MSKLKSLFSAADKMQVMIDRSKDLYAPLWYRNYFDVAPPQQSLNYTTVIGRSRIEAAASVVERDAATPQRSRAGLEKLNGEIPAIRQMLTLRETEYREFMAIQNVPTVDDKVKLKAMIDLIWGDIKKCGDGCQKRVDAMCLMAVSTGKIKINVANNPDGVVHVDVDLLMAAENKKQAGVSWATAATAKPIFDINTVVNDAKRRGISFAKILMHWELWLKLIATTEVKESLMAYFYGPKPGAGFNPSAITLLDNVNTYLTANRLPIIEIVDESIGIEKDGKITPTNFFDVNNVAFVPAGRLGTIKNAIAMEKMSPVEKVSYADYNGVLISKWHNNEPWGEWTKGEWNAFPSLDAIDSMYILTAVFE